MLEECEISQSIIDTGLTKVYFSEEGFLFIEFIDEYTVEPEDIYEIREAMLKLTQGSPARVIVKPGKFGSITKEAREMDMFKVHDSSIIEAVAVVTQQLHQKILGTLYFKFKPKKYPYRLFKNEEKAQNWLKSVQN